MQVCDLPLGLRRGLMLALLACLPLGGGCELIEPAEVRLNGVESASAYFSDAKVRDLAKAAAAGRVDEVKRLIAQGADPNTRGKDTMTPLMWAVLTRSSQGVKALVEGGARAQDHVNIKSGRGETIRLFPIMLAARFRDPAMVEALLEHGANPETKGDGVNTALDESIHCLRCFQLLVEHGADINRGAEGAPGWTAVAGAVVVRQYDIVLWALQHGYNVELDALNYRVENGSLADHLQPLRAQILALLKTKDVKPWLPPYLREMQQGKDTTRH